LDRKAEKPALNIAFYRSDEMQNVLGRARMRTDQNERIALYQEAQAIFHRDVPWVPLAHAQRILVINRSVQNLKLSPVGWKYLRNVSLESE
jgi:peptide/nickel transport system substrate-binding protein